MAEEVKLNTILISMMLPEFKLKAWRHHDRLTFVVPSHAVDGIVVKAKAFLSIIEAPFEGITSAVSVREENCFFWLWCLF